MTEDNRHQEVLDEVIQPRVAHGERKRRSHSRAHRARDALVDSVRGRRQDLQARAGRDSATARRAERRSAAIRCASGSTRRSTQFIERLNTSPEFAAKVDAWKEEFLDNEAARKFSASLWQDGKEALAQVRRRARIRRAERDRDARSRRSGQKALDDPELLAKLDEFAVDVAVFLVARYQDEVAELIATTVAAWDPELTSRRVELAIGRDLQFIRINGTIVGGLAGMLIYLISSLFP